MKKLLLLAIIATLTGCTKYNETGLVCADAEHDFDHAVTTLDVSADYETAKIVLNGEKITLKSDDPQEKEIRLYGGVNAAGEPVYLSIFDGTLDKQGETRYFVGSDKDKLNGCLRKEDIEIK